MKLRAGIVDVTFRYTLAPRAESAHVEQGRRRMRRCADPQGLHVDAWRMVGPTSDRYAPPDAGSRSVAGRQPCGARESPRRGGPVRTHERSGGTSLWQVE